MGCSSTVAKRPGTNGYTNAIGQNIKCSNSAHLKDGDIITFGGAYGIKVQFFKKNIFPEIVLYLIYLLIDFGLSIILILALVLDQYLIYK